MSIVGVAFSSGGKALISGDQQGYIRFCIQPAADGVDVHGQSCVASVLRPKQGTYFFNLTVVSNSTGRSSSTVGTVNVARARRVFVSMRFDGEYAEFTRVYPTATDPALIKMLAKAEGVSAHRIYGISYRSGSVIIEASLLHLY
eukprot:tig00021036_g17398.t1